jgi:signal peptidase I
VSRTRALIVVALVVVFVIVSGALIYANTRPAGPKNLTFSVAVTKGESMQPNDLKAHVNDTITINLTSDMDGEVHLHTYDIAFETVAGQTVTHTFKADKTCECEIEWEETSHELGTLEVSP